MSLAVYAFSLAILAVATVFIIPQSSKLNVERKGRGPGFLGLSLIAAKKEFAVNGHHLIADGYKMFRDAKFVVQTQDMERLIISPKYLSELRMLPESKLSHSAALVERYVGHFNKIDVILQNHHHSDVCRNQLTQQLPRFLPEMAEELELSMSQFLADYNLDDFATIPTYSYVYKMVLNVTSRVFVGLPLARDKAWLDTMNDYLAEVFAIANALRPYPPLLRSILRPFLAPKCKIDAVFSDAMKVLSPAIEERRSLVHNPTDVLGFLVQADKEEDSMIIISKLLVILGAALHTSAMAATHALYDLCERPNIIRDLRIEAQMALREESGSWHFSTVKKLRKLDSFMKESLRYNQPDTLGFSRIAMSPVKLSDGFVIPTGTFINMAAEPMSRDATYYDNPNEFNGYRFFKAPGKSNVSVDPLQEFFGIEPGNLVWGSGRLTCPGRWYAGALNKLIVGSLLTQYDVKFPSGQTKRPKNLYKNGAIMPDPMQVLLLRKLDFDPGVVFGV